MTAGNFSLFANGQNFDSTNSRFDPGLVFALFFIVSFSR